MVKGIIKAAAIILAVPLAYALFCVICVFSYWHEF
jgi:hypothetical protein